MKSSVETQPGKVMKMATNPESYAAGAAGGLQQYRSAMARAWENAPWSNDLELVDGYFGRTLHKTDRDIELIHELLEDLSY